MHKTDLKDRVLFSDGDSVVSPSQIMSLVSSGVSTEGLFVEKLTKDIDQFNKFVSKKEQIGIKQSVRPNNFDWDLPQEYAEIEPSAYVVQTFYEMLDGSMSHLSLVDKKKRKQRIIKELTLYEDMGLLPVLRVLIYIINTLREKNIVWGVGRGSSVSSYVLYIIGIHDVDSVEYDLDITDFLRV